MHKLSGVVKARLLSAGWFTAALVISTFFGLIAQGPTASGVFQADTNMSVARDGASAAVLADGSVLVTGGKDSSGAALASAELLGSSTPVGPMTYARSGHTSVTLQDGRVLVSGGIPGSNDAQIYDPASGWSASFAMGQPRVGGTATLLNDGRVLLAGGDGSTLMEIFDPATGVVSNAANMSAARRNHAATVLRDGRVVIAGGSDANGLLNSIDIYKPETNSVAEGPAMAAPREHLSASTLMEQQVLLAGGAGATTEILNVAAGTVLAGPAMSAARSGHVALLLPNNNTILMVGGAASAGAEIYVPWATPNATNQFQAFGTLANVREGAAAGAAFSAPYSETSLSAGQARIAGGAVSGSTTNAVEIVKFPTVIPDKWDYQPGDTVHIHGAGFAPGELVDIHMHEDPVPVDEHADIVPVTADVNGAFDTDIYLVLEHDLNVRFYLTATGAGGLTAGTTFTDSRTITSVTLNGLTSVTVAASASIAAVVNVTTTATGGGNSDKWKSTGWRISTTAPAVSTDLNC